MALLPGFGGQIRPTPLFDASGTITNGGTAQLGLGVSQSRSYLLIQNNHASGTLRADFGSARATATLSSGTVASCTITNGGFGFLFPPIVQFIGGGDGGFTGWVPSAQPGYPAPGFVEGGGVPTVSGSRPATAHAVLTGGVVTSIVIDDPGAGYVAAPLVFMRNDPRDTVGAADPNFGSAVGGSVILNPGGSLVMEASFVTTDQVALFSATASLPYTIKFAP